MSNKGIKRRRVENQFEGNIVSPPKLALKTQYIGFGRWKVPGTYDFHNVSEKKVENKKQFVCDCQGSTKEVYQCCHIRAVVLKQYLDYLDIVVDDKKKSVDIIDDLSELLGKMNI